METASWLLVAASTIDRGGIPLALVIGAGHLASQGQDPTVFVSACAVAAVGGDMACFWIGRLMRGEHSRSRHGAFERSPASFRSRIHHVARFVETAPRTWLCGGRMFSAVNQFVPMACGLLGRPVMECLLCSTVGALAWSFLWGWAAREWTESFISWGTTARIATAAIGFALATWSLRLIRRPTDVSEVDGE